MDRLPYCSYLRYRYAPLWATLMQLILDRVSSRCVDAGGIVRDARQRHRVSQRSLARRCRTSQTYISRVENGQVSPSVETLTRLLQAMGEELEIRAVPGARGNRTDAELRADLELTAAERVAQAAELSYALTSIAAAGTRA